MAGVIRVDEIEKSSDTGTGIKLNSPLQDSSGNQLISETGIISGDITIPSGTTAERPVSPSNGMMRYNTTNKQTEIYNGSYWLNVYTEETDPYWNDVVCLVQGIDGIDQTGRHSITLNNVNITNQYGTPFSKSNGWVYRLGDGGASDHLVFGNNLSDFDWEAETNWTAEFWIYHISGSSYGHMFSIGGQDGKGVFKYYGTTPAPYVYSSAGGGVQSTPYLIKNPGWTFLVLERDGTNSYIYMDGRKVGTATNYAWPTGTPTKAVLGSFRSSEYAIFAIDEFRYTLASRYQGAIEIPIPSKSFPTQG